MTKELINPESQYKSERAYSKAVKVDVGDSEMLFVSGQIPKNENGEIVGKGDFGKQTEYCFEKIITILVEAGMDLNDLVKVNIYVTDMNRFEEVSAARNKYLKESRPAATSVEISGTPRSERNTKPPKPKPRNAARRIAIPPNTGNSKRFDCEQCCVAPPTPWTPRTPPEQGDRSKERSPRSKAGASSYVFPVY